MCSWTILTSIVGEQIQLHFIDFQTMPGQDYLYVYDGGSSSSPLIRTYDGYMPDGSVPEDVISTGNALTLIFDTLRLSKSDTNYRGFEVKYFLKGNLCFFLFPSLSNLYYKCFFKISII